MENRRISMDELSQKLVSSRKIMHKVDGGDFSKGNVSRDILKSPEEIMEGRTPLNAPIYEGNETNYKPKAPQPITESKILNSKLPDNIKKAMMENPIQQIGLDSTLDMSFVERTRQLMEEDGSVLPKQTVRESRTTQPQTKQPTTISSSDLERRLTPIIENIIRKTLDEIVDRKLNQILSASQGQSINENLAIKVGDSIFTGKLTKVKSSK